MKSWIKNWFSNFEVLQNPIVIDGIEYWSVENFYAASKSLDVKEKKHIASLSPSAAKKFAKKVKLRPDWEQVKLAIMLKGLVAKFRWHLWNMISTVVTPSVKINREELPSGATGIFTRWM